MAPDRKLHRSLKFIASFTLVTFLSQQISWAAPLQQELPSPYSVQEKVPGATQESAAQNWTETNNPPLWQDFVQESKTLQRPSYEDSRKDPVGMPGETLVSPAQVQHYDYERYGFEDALEQLRPEYASAVILRELKARDLDALTQLTFEVGITVIEGEIILFTSGAKDEIRVSEPAKKLLERASFIAHTHPAASQEQGPSLMDLTAAGALHEYVITDETIFRYNSESLASGDVESISQGVFLAHLNYEVSQNRENQVEVRALLNDFIRSIDLLNTSPDESIVFRAGDNDVTFTSATVRSVTNQDPNASQYEISDSGNLLHLWGNNWKAINFGKTITANTVIEFDFRSAGALPEINSIGFSNTLTEQASTSFQINGDQLWTGNKGVYHYLAQGDWQHYVIRAGQFFTGTFNYLMLGNDADAGQLTDVFFRNIRIYDTTTPPKFMQPFVETGGRVVIEAEHPAQGFQRSSDAWTARTTLSGFSGEGYVITEPNNNSVQSTTFSTTSAELRYPIKIASPGTYYVWLRGRAASTSDDSIHVGFNNAAVSTADNFTLGSLNSFVWTKNTSDGVRASINVTTAGEHTLNVWMREDGFALDKIILTKDANFVPTGVSLSESARSPEPTGPAIVVTSAGTSADQNYTLTYTVAGVLKTETWLLGSGVNKLTIKASDSSGRETTVVHTVTWNGPAHPEPDLSAWNALQPAELLQMTTDDGFVLSYKDGVLMSVEKPGDYQLIVPTLNAAGDLTGGLIRYSGGSEIYYQGGKALWLKDPRGIRYVYNADGTVREMIDTQPVKWPFAYRLNVSSAVDLISVPSASAVTAYSSEGLLFYSLQNSGKKMFYQNGILQKVIEASGASVQYAIDALQPSGFKAVLISPASADYPLWIEFDSNRSITRVKRQNNDIIRFLDGLPVQVTDAQGVTSTYVFDDNLAADLTGFQVSRLGYTQTFDASGSLTGIELPGNPEDVLNINGSATSTVKRFELDHGKVTQVELSDGTIVDFGSQGYEQGSTELTQGTVHFTDGSRIRYAAGAPVEMTTSDGKIYDMVLQSTQYIATLRAGQSTSSDQVAQQFIYDANMKLVQLTRLNQEIIRFRNERTDEIIPNCQPGAPDCSDPQYFYYEADRTVSVQGAFSTRPALSTVNSYLGFPHSVSVYDLQGQPVSIRTYEAAKLTRVDFNYGKIRKIWECNLTETACTEKFRYTYEFLENGEEVTVITDLAENEVRKYLSDRILSYLNKDGILTAYTYGPDERVKTSLMSWQGKEIDSFTYTYDDVNDVKKIADSKGVTRIYNQDDDKLVGVIQEGQEFVIHHFTENGQPKTAQELIRETRDNGITYFYSMGRITKMQYADGAIVEDLIEDTNGKVFSARITHPDGSVERIVNGQKVEIVRSDASIWTYEGGKLATVKDSLGRETRYEYENGEILLLTHDGARHRYTSQGQFIASQFPESPSYSPGQGNQVFKDMSGQNHALTTIGQAHVDKIDSKFGGASARFDGGGDYLRTDNSAAWDFGSGDFTIDMWFKPEQVGGTHALFAADYVNGTVYNGMTILPDGSLHAYFGSGSTQLQSAAGAITANRWYHAAAVRSGNVFTLYIDGKAVATRIYSGAVSNNGSEMQIGTLRFESYVQDFKGRLDEFRITKGLARWRSEFAVPSTPPVLDGNTTFLLQLGDMTSYFSNNAGPSNVDVSAISLSQLDYDILSTTLTQTAVGNESDFQKARVVAHSGDEITLERPTGDRLTYKAGKLIKEVEVGTEYTRFYAYQDDLTLVTESGSVKTFNAAGKLIAFKDYSGVEYNVSEILESGQIAAYELSSGALKVRTDVTGKVLSVTDNGLTIQLDGETVISLEKDAFLARDLDYSISQNESDPLANPITWGPSTIATNAYLGASANIAHTSDSREGVVDLIDLNGDGFLDRVLAQDSNAAWKVQFNTGNGFAAAVDFGPIRRAYNWVRDDYISHISDAKETRVTLIDLNGDRKPDRVFALDGNTAWKVQWNNGTGFSELQDFGPIQRAVASVRNDYIQHVSDAQELRVALMDLNGDGLPDRIQAQDSNAAWKVQFNTGTGFGPLTDFGPIRRGYNWVRDDYIQHVSDAGELRVALMDLNGDKRPDRIFAQDSGAWKVQWNTGTGFSELQSFGPIQRADQNSVRYNYISYTANGSLVDLIDLNGDGLPDRLQTVSGSPQWKVQWNTGAGFSDLQNFDAVNLLNSDANYAQLKNYSGNQLRSSLRDMNGDGLVDRIQSSEGGTTWRVELNQSSVVGIQSAEILMNGAATTRFAGGSQTLSTGTSVRDVTQFKSYAHQAARALQKTSARNFYGLKFTLPTAPKNIAEHEIQGTVTIQSTPLFEDASAQQHQIQAVGGAIHETGNAKTGTTSGRFDGVDDRVVIDDSQDWAFGSQDFTIDFWVNFDSLQGTQYIYSQSGDAAQLGTSAGNYNALGMWNNGGAYTWYVPVKSGNVIIMNGQFVDTGLTANEWHHVALVRSGNTFKLYRNGVQIGSTHNSTISIPDYASGIEIGAFNAGSHFKGALDEFRVSKGKALWTANFRPEDVSVGAGTETKLLLFSEEPQETYRIRMLEDGVSGEDLSPPMSPVTPNFDDASFHNHSVAPSGAIALESRNEALGVGVFDGIDDKLVVNDSSALDFGTSDFTLDGWFTLAAASRMYWFTGSTAGSTDWLRAAINPLDQRLELHVGNSAFYFPRTFLPNTRYHVAIVRSNGVFKVFVDGQQVGSNAAYNQSINANGPIQVGARNDGVDPWHGKIDDFRVSRTARWTSNFTPPAVNLPAEASTALLLFSHLNHQNQQVSDFVDASAQPHTVTAVGGARFELSNVKAGQFHGVFDGVNDKLVVPDEPVFDFGNGDFTVEGWVKFSALDIDYYTVASKYSGGAGWAFVINPYWGDLYMYDSGWSSRSVRYNGFKANEWFHLAVVRSGSIMKFFVNGVQIGADQPAAATYNGTGLDLHIGAYDAHYASGAMDEVRISSGFARYTSNFTPPSNSLTPDAYTSLLLFSDHDSVAGSEIVYGDYSYVYNGGILTSISSVTDGHYDAAELNGSYYLIEEGFKHRYNAQGQLLESIGSNGLKDVSTASKVPVIVGDVNGDQSQFKHQGASIRFDGAGDYLTFANSPDWDYGSNDFTIDAWLRLDQLNTMQEIWSQYTGGGLNNNLFFYIGADNKLSAYVEKNGATWANLIGTTSLQRDAWYHVALVREQGNIKIFLNGALERSVPVSGGAPSGNFSVTAGATYSGSGYTYHLKGWMDELRVTRRAVWTGNSFSVPAGPSTADADTRLLLRTGKDAPSVLPPTTINPSYFKLSTANFTGPVAVIEKGRTSFQSGSSAASGVLDLNRLVIDYNAGVRQPSEIIYSVFDQAGVLVYTQKLDGTLTHYESGRVKTVWGRGGVLIQTYEYDTEGNPLKVSLHQMREDFPVKIQMAREKVEEQKLIALRNLASQQATAIQQIAAQFADARAKLEAQRESLMSQRYQKVCKQTLCWNSCETIEVPGVSEAIEQLNGAILELSVREAQAYVDLQNQIAQAKLTLETEITNAFLQIDQQEISFRREIIRQEISPLIFHYYRKYLGRDANKAEYDQWINGTNYDTGFDVAALKQTLSGKDANGNTVTTSYTAELNSRTSSVNQIKSAVSVFLDDYAVKNAAERAALAQTQLGMQSADLVNLSQPEIQKVKIWLNSRSLHFGQSAFIALERMLAQAGISYNREVLAKNLILIDILSGIITPFEEGDLLISLFAIKHYASRLGLNTTGLNASFDDLDRFYAQNPGRKMIAHINGDHYVVIEDILDVFDAESGQWIRKIKYLDPGAGAEGQNQMMEIAEADFVKVWQGNLLTTVSDKDIILQLHSAAPNTGNIPPPRELSKKELQKVRGAFFFFLIPFIVAIVINGDKIIKDTWNYIKQSLQNLAVSIAQLVTGDIAGLLRTTIQQMSNTLIYSIKLFTEAMGTALSLIPFIGEPIGNFVKSAGQKITGLIQKGTQAVSNFLTKAAPVINFFSKWTPTNPETLKKLGFSDKMANYVSQAITVVIITVVTGGNLPVALASMAASIAVQEIGPRIGLSPQLTAVLSMVASAAAGAGVGSFGSGTFVQALKDMAPNLAGGFAQVGIMAVGSALGLDPRLAQVLSVPFALGAGGFVKGAFSGASGLDAAFTGAKNAIINGAVGGLISAGASIAGVPPVFNGLLSGLLGQIADSSGGNSGQGSSLVGQSLFSRVADNFKRFGGAIADAAGSVVSFGQKVLEGVGTVTKAGFSKALDFFSGAFDRPTQEKLRTAGNGSIENAFLNSDFLQLDANLYQAVVHFGGEDITVRYDKGVEKITLLSASSERTLTGAVKDQAGNYFGNMSLKDYWANGQYAVQNFSNTLGSFGVFSASDELLLEISPLDISTPVTFNTKDGSLLNGKLKWGVDEYVVFEEGKMINFEGNPFDGLTGVSVGLPESLISGARFGFDWMSMNPILSSGPSGLVNLRVPGADGGSLGTARPLTELLAELQIKLGDSNPKVSAIMNEINSFSGNPIPYVEIVTETEQSFYLPAGSKVTVTVGGEAQYFGDINSPLRYIINASKGGLVEAWEVKSQVAIPSQSGAPLVRVVAGLGSPLYEPPPIKFGLESSNNGNSIKLSLDKTPFKTGVSMEIASSAGPVATGYLGIRVEGNELQLKADAAILASGSALLTGLTGVSAGALTTLSSRIGVAALLSYVPQLEQVLQEI